MKAGTASLRRILAVLVIAAGSMAGCGTARAAVASAAPVQVGAARVRIASLGGVTSTLLSPVAAGASALDPVTAGAGALAGVALSAISSWVLDGAKAALDEAAKIISRTTAPRLESTWFSASYWRVAGLAFLLTVPFLFAAAIQSVVRADLALLGRAAMGYLPLAMIGIGVAAPLTMLLLAATDEMCGVVGAIGVGGGAGFLVHAGADLGGADLLGGTPFYTFILALLTVTAAVGLTLEMLIREAAVYVVELMLPLAFAALVWPARRIWAIRLVELLVSLILSKFAIVAVLSLAGAAVGQGGGAGVTGLLTAMALLALSTFAPWAMLRLLPFTEVAAGAAGALRAEVPRLHRQGRERVADARNAADLAASLPSRLRSHAEQAQQAQQDGTEWRAQAGGPPRSDQAGRNAGGATAGQAPPEGATDDGAIAVGAAAIGPASGGAAVNSAEAGGGATGDGAGPGPAIAADDGGGRARLADLPSRWHAGNGEWPPFVLGPDGCSGPTDHAPEDDGIATGDEPRPAPQEGDGGPL